MPQLAASLVMFTHALPHAVNPVAHENPQTLVLHVAIAFAGAVHLVPHAPQLSASLRVSTQDPLQSVVFVPHNNLQTPCEQA
jgi:hypothetical protein